MKLNYECVRDVLLYLENQDYFAPADGHIVAFCPVYIEDIAAELPGYSLTEIYYTLSNLAQAGYIDANEQAFDFVIERYRVDRITFQGHEFLAKIRDEGHWSVVRKGLSVVKDCSLSAIGAIAQGMTSALIDTFIKTKG